MFKIWCFPENVNDGPQEPSIRCTTQWPNNGVAAASSDGGPTGGKGPPTVVFYFKSEGRGPDLRK